jgi:hypothetical protein
LVTLATLSGCATLQEDRDLCLAVAAGTGAALGGVAGGLILSEAVEHGDSGGSKNWEIAGGALGGTALGGLIGWGIGELVCEEPPPPPPPARPAPPPPPPATDRRGG